MKTPTITSVQSKAARAALGISQSKVARATGINRSQLALLEVQKYLLDDARLNALRAYYEGLGYQFDATAPTPDAPGGGPSPLPESDSQEIRADARVVDGFAVPVGIDGDALEALLDEIDANDQKIVSLAGQKAQFDWFTDKPDAEARDEVVRLMARNYLRVRQLQCGGDGAQQANIAKGPEGSSVGDLVAQLVGLPLGESFTTDGNPDKHQGTRR